MICCVAIGCVIAFAIRFWKIITFQPIVKAEQFAPVAQRVIGQSANQYESARLENASSKSYATIFILYLLSIACYQASLSLSEAFGLIEFLSESDSARGVVLSALISYFVLLSLFYRKRKYTVTNLQLGGVFATVIGIVSLAFGIADVHIFQVVQFSGGHAHHAHHHTFTDFNTIIFHGVSVLMIVIGFSVYRLSK